MPVTMGGISSGIDTDGIIEKLVNVESRPLKKLEEEKNLSKRKKDALGALSKSLNKLNDAAKDLYGFRAAYDEKKATSSDTEVLEAIAAKNAEKGLKKIIVERTASTNKISTDEIDENRELPAGKIEITVNKEKKSFKFNGGLLKTLRDKIEEAASDLVSTHYIRTTDNNYILTIESKTSGKKGEISINGDIDFLKKITLIKGEKDQKKDEINIVFDKRYFTSYIGDKKIESQDGLITIAEDGKSVKLKGLLWQEYVLPAESEIKDDTILEFDFLYTGLTDDQIEEDKLLPPRMETGPDEKINIKGIELHGYNVSRIRKIDKKDKKKIFDSILGVGAVSVENGKRTEKTYLVDKDSKVKQEIPLGRDFKGKKISKLIFYTNEGSTDYKNAKITTPLKSDGKLEAKNTITPAEDAIIKVDGVEIKRDKNNDLSDVIKGVTLNLKQSSKSPVEITVTPDITKSVEKIRKFVETYNAYIDLHRELIRTEKINKPGEKNRKGENGLFVGDMTIIRLENTVRSTVSGAYPNNAETPIKLITQLGVSTGKVNSEWDSIKTGKLIIDEVELEKAIRDNPEAVKNFFASDVDGDTRTDSGMAYSLVSNIKPYISFGKNIIASKIELEDNSITMANEKIERKGEHLKIYESKLRSKFSKMEKAMSASKSQKNWLNNQNISNQNKDK